MELLVIRSMRARLDGAHGRRMSRIGVCSSAKCS